MRTLPAILRDPAGHYLSLEILGYQFPAITSGADADWLMIRMTARSMRGEWTATDSALETWDVAVLSAWCRGLAAGEAVADRIEFIEPCLAALTVEGTGDAARVTVLLGYAFRPLGMPLFETDRLTLMPGAAGLAQFAADLDAALAALPARRS